MIPAYVALLIGIASWFLGRVHGISFVDNTTSGEPAQFAWSILSLIAVAALIGISVHMANSL